MGREARAKLAQLRECPECGQQKPVADFRPVTTNLEVCRACVALWIEEGFLKQENYAS